MNLFDTKEAALMLKSVKAIICLSVVALFIVTVRVFLRAVADGAADGYEPALIALFSIAVIYQRRKIFGLCRCVQNLARAEKHLFAQ